MKSNIFIIILMHMSSVVLTANATQWPVHANESEIKKAEWLIDFWHIDISDTQFVHSNGIFAEEILGQIFGVKVHKFHDSETNQGFVLMDTTGKKIATCGIRQYKSHEDAIADFLIGFTRTSMVLEDKANRWSVIKEGPGQLCLAERGFDHGDGVTNEFIIAFRDNIVMSINPYSSCIDAEVLLREMDQILLAEYAADEYEEQQETKGSSVSGELRVASEGTVAQKNPATSSGQQETDQAVESTDAGINKMQLWPYGLLIIAGGILFWMVRKFLGRKQ